MSTITVTNLTDSGVSGEIDLRQAIAEAGNGDTIVFARSQSSSINVDLSAPLEIAAGKSITIDLGANSGFLNSIDSTESDLNTPIIIVAGADVTIENATLRLYSLGANSPDTPGNGDVGADGTNGGQSTGQSGSNAGAGQAGAAATHNGGDALGAIQNYGDLTLVDDYLVGTAIAGAGASGGVGGIGGDGGGGGSGVNATSNNSDGGPGGNAGNSGAGGTGGAGSSGGNAVGGIYNAAGANLTIQDSAIDGDAGGGAGGNGGNGGLGGAGISGGDGGFGLGSGVDGAGGNGGSGGNGGASGASGNGGNAVGGVLNNGTINVVGGAVLSDDMASAGHGGASGETNGSSGGPAGSGEPDGGDGADGADGAVGLSGIQGTAVTDVLNNGTIVGALTANGIFFNLDSADSSGATSGANYSYVAEVEAVGTKAPSNTVDWRVVTGANGPALTDFTSATSGVLNFSEFYSINSSEQITLNLTFRANEPKLESFTIELSNPSAGDVLGTKTTLDVTVVNPLSNVEAPTLSLTSPPVQTNSANQTITGTIDTADVGQTVDIYDGGTLIGTAAPSSNGTWSAHVTLTGNGQHSLTAQATASGVTGSSPAIVDTLNTVAGATFTVGDGQAAVSLTGTGGAWDNVNGSQGLVYLSNAQTNISGGDDKVYFVGSSGNDVSLYITQGVWDAASGDDATVYLTSAQASVSGGNDAVVFAGGTGNAVSFYTSVNNWEGVTGSNGTVYLTNAQASVQGGDDLVDFAGGAGNAVSFYNSANDWEDVAGSNGTIYLTSAQASVQGGGDLVDFAGGAGNAVSFYNSANDWEDVAGSNGNVYLTNAQASVQGGGDSVDFAGGSGDAVSLYSTGNTWDSVSGSKGVVYLTNAQASIFGELNSITFAGGSGNAVSLYATQGIWDTVNGSNGNVYLTSAQASVIGGGNSIVLSGSGDIVAIANATSLDTISGSNALVDLYGSEALSLNGESDTLAFQAGIGGHDSIAGFAAGDSAQFSKSDFADFAALSNHLTQSGANAVITLNASDSVSLVDVQALSLTSAQFKFV